jgi:pyrroline-5-carboxylate reductase
LKRVQYLTEPKQQVNLGAAKQSSDMTPNYKLTFIGAGRMAGAMVRSLINQGTLEASSIACCGANDGTAEALARETGIHIVPADGSVAFTTDCLVLACKPQQLRTIEPAMIRNAEGSLLLSILAGTRIATLQSVFSSARNTVRAMPNTPGSIGAGVTAYAAGAPLEAADLRCVQDVLGSMGPVIAVQEAELDSVTAVSGSGPAYLFLFVEAMTDAALAQGFSPETADLLARQTVIGAAKLLEATGSSAESLRVQVTSPGGTTQAALESFTRNRFKDIVADAVECARIRSVELSQLA